MNGSLSFLESVAGYVMASATSTDQRVKLGTVDAAYVTSSYPGTLPKITFDGEATLSGKTYPVIGPYLPTAGDRVALIPVGTTYAIIGALDADASLRVGGTISAAGAMAAVASRTTNQTIANNTNSDVTLTAEETDTSGMFTATSAVVTIPAGGDGVWDVTAWAVWAVGGTGWRRLAVSKNNGTTTGVDSWHVLWTNPGTGADCGQNITVGRLPLVASDTIRIKAWHTQGSDLNIAAARLSVVRALA